MMALEGVSIGFQLGGQATDFVLLVMNDRGASSILSSKVKLGDNKQRPFQGWETGWAYKDAISPDIGRATATATPSPMRPRQPDRRGATPKLLLM